MHQLRPAILILLVGLFLLAGLLLVGVQTPVRAADSAGVMLQQSLGFLDSAVERARVRLAGAETLWNDGQSAEAMLWLEAASLEVATVENQEILFDLHLRSVPLLQRFGRPNEALARLDAWERFTTHLDDPLSITSLTARLAESFHKIGRNDRALRALDHLIRLMEMVQDPNGLASILCIRAKVLQRLGESGRAAELLDAARGQVARVREDMMLPDGRPLPAAFLRANLGRMVLDILLDMGREAEVEQQWRQVSEDIARVDDHALADDLHAGMAAVAGKRGQPEALRQHLEAIGDFSLRRTARADAVRALIAAGHLNLAMELCEGIPASPLFDEALLDLASAIRRRDGDERALAVIEEIRSPALRLEALARMLDLRSASASVSLLRLLGEIGTRSTKEENP